MDVYSEKGPVYVPGRNGPMLNVTKTRHRAEFNKLNGEYEEAAKLYRICSQNTKFPERSIDYQMEADECMRLAKEDPHYDEELDGPKVTKKTTKKTRKKVEKKAEEPTVDPDLKIWNGD